MRFLDFSLFFTERVTFIYDDKFKLLNSNMTNALKYYKIDINRSK